MAVMLTGTLAANNASVTVHTAATLMLATDTGDLRIADGTSTWSTLPDAYKVAPIASPTFTGTVTITPTAVYGANQTPNQTAAGAGSAAAPGDFNVGILFTADVDGQVTHLGAKLNDTGSHTVRLYNGAGTLLGSVVIVGIAGTWVRTALGAPIALSAGGAYTVAVRSTTFYQQAGIAPVTTGGITITGGRYIAASDAVPTGDPGAGFVYFADITFQPATIDPPISTTYPSYASNAAAITGGLTAGMHYRQGDFVAVVH